MNTAPSITEIQGTVSAIHYAKASFSAGRIRAKGREISFSVKGFVKLGEPVTLRGEWKNHPKYGRQFEASEVAYTLPADADGLAKWLEWNVPSVGAVKARKLIDEFGLDLTRLASEDPQQVAIHAGMPIEAVHRIAEEWSKFSAKISAASELATLGLTQHQVEILWSKFKGSAITILREDPYLLLREVEGFGFATVDEIARKMGIPESHPGRKRAAYVTAVFDAREKDGSTAIREAAAIEAACGMLDLPAEQYAGEVVTAAEHAAEIGHIHRAETSHGEFSVGTPAAFRHEELIWKTLATGADVNPFYRVVGPAEFITENYARIGDKTLDADQLAAVVMAAKHRITFITGGAGSGKTLVARAICKVFTDAKIPVHLCAPTGKAARRLADVIGRDASTIHRLLGYNPGGGFAHDNLNPIEDGLIIVDEVSMVDSDLAYHLLRAVSPRSSVVCIGDPNQLPPVGPGAMLRDVLAHNLTPVSRLSHCHRQAGPLKANCAAILAGRIEPSVMEIEPAPWMVHDSLMEPARVAKAIRALFEKYLPLWGYDSVRDVQFLTAKHAGDLGTKYLNRVCQWMHQRKLGVELDEPNAADVAEGGGRATLYPGDKVIQTKNNYTLGVMNGQQGTVESVGKYLVVCFDDKEVSYSVENKGEVDLSYVITPHKAQGSEWPCAVVVCHKSHKFMQTRSWLYTACTRAQKTAVIIGDEPSIRRAAENDRRDTRGTWLEVWARNEGARPQ